MITLSGHSVVSARVMLPTWGVWWAEVTLTEGADLEGPVVLSLEGLALAGSVMSGGVYAGAARYRIAGGAGGWGRVLPPKSYANDAGVKASTIIADAAAACGEMVDVSPLAGVSVGPAYVREGGPAGRVLEAVAPRGWYVGEDGVTRIGRRPRTAVTADVAVLDCDLASGVVRVDAPDLGQLVPGAVVEGVEAVDVVHEAANGGVVTTIYGAGIASTSRRLAALSRLLEQLDPARRFRGVYEYRVVTQEGERLSLQPVRVSLGMPDLRRVLVRPGIAGARCEVELGARVLVAFVDADRARPVVVGFEDAEGSGFAPRALYLGGLDDLADPLTAAGRVVRYGDQVTIPVVGASAVGAIALDPTATSVSRVRA